MTDIHMTLFCLVDGEATPFSVDIDPSKTVDHLKKAIKAEKTNVLGDVDADALTLWHVSIPLVPLNERKPVFLNQIDSATELDPADDLADVFEPRPSRKIHEPKLPKKIDVIVKQPPQAPKRDREEDAGPSSKRRRFDTYTLKDAIEEAGLTQKAVADGRSNLSRLDNKERVSVLSFMGREIDETNRYDSLSSTAFELQGENVQDMDKLSAPHGCKLPVVETNDLYVRKAFKELYDTILGTFEDSRPYDPDVRKHVLVTGTSGIGKSAFLVYFAIRLLAESDDDNPPMVIFHTKRSEQCFVFGGRSTVRSGNIEDFMPFLSLPDTWYLVDSSPDPVLPEAKTIISASPKTLSSEAQHYQDVDKRVSWRYYMAPWSLEELKTCRGSVAAFKVVPLEMLEELYLDIGGVPRYVLEAPMTVLKLNPRNLKGAKAAACQRLETALSNIKDPITMMQYFSQGKDTLEFSSRLMHRWPSHDHSGYRLEWASTSVATRVSALLTDDACKSMLKKVIEDPDGSASGIMFEAYVLRTFREGGYTFELKDLKTGELARLNIPRNPTVKNFHTITSANAGELWIPRIRNYACVDLLMPPKDLFQVTVSRTHSIKGLPFSKLINSLTEERWVASPKEVRIIFVVPSYNYGQFQEQKYLDAAGKVYATLPAKIQRVKQYAVKIDLDSAAAGHSPGLEVPARRNPSVPARRNPPVPTRRNPPVPARRNPPRTKRRQ